MVVPLTKLLSIKRKCIWTKVEQDAFDKIKRIVDRGTLLSYTGFNETFKIDKNASVLQLGAFINQKVNLSLFSSRKLNSAQQRYTVTDRELLSIVETLK